MSKYRCMKMFDLRGGRWEHRIEQCRRVYSPEALCPTIMADSNISDDKSIKMVENNKRIRKLTERELWRLMGFDDKDFDAAKEVVSSTQLTKQAGNSICVNVLEAIFGQMIEGKENEYKERWG